jgi:hypothetical protein
MSSFLLSLAAVTWLVLVPAEQKQAPPPPPSETFDLTATASAGPGAVGTLTVPMVVHIERYTPAHARTTMTDALKHAGYSGFLNALREAPVAGSLTIGDQSWVIRWARQVPSSDGRVVSIVTDKPVAFVGGGRTDAKPKAGYEVAVAQFTVDRSGHGTGTMAAAARVKPGGETGVRIDDYAEKPVTLTAVARPQK